MNEVARPAPESSVEADSSPAYGRIAFVASDAPDAVQAQA
ncbi:MAG: ATP-NAD/AcoX kinase, partial [Xanthobacteraceae bacterium]|nr:ATP-NAD/AcoX kinase [Xanthobacteraceae bacterium]